MFTSALKHFTRRVCLYHLKGYFPQLGSFLLIFQCSKVSFVCILSAGVPRWCWAWKQACMGLLWWGITMWSICIWTWVIVSAIVITWEATSPRRELSPQRMDRGGPLAQQGLSLSHQSPNCSTLSGFCSRTPAMPQTLLAAASWSPDENIHFTPQTYFFPLPTLSFIEFQYNKQRGRYYFTPKDSN